MGLFILFCKKAKKARINNPVKIQENDEIIAQITNEMLETYFSHPASNFFPLDYFDEYAIDALTTYVANFRADSLKDALNLFETEAHQRRLEDQQQEMIFTQKEILSQAQYTAKAATASAVFSGISAYNSVKIKNDINEINSKL